MTAELGEDELLATVLSALDDAAGFWRETYTACDCSARDDPCDTCADALATAAEYEHAFAFLAESDMEPEGRAVDVVQVRGAPAMTTPGGWHCMGCGADYDGDPEAHACTATAADSQWKNLALASRAALALLGHDITPLCLPDEPDACGAGYELHALAHLATLAAVIDHHLEHLGGVDSPTVQEIYTHAAAEQRERCQAAP